MSSKPQIIKCPHCGAEYLPQEIYVPSYIGKSMATTESLVKDSDGKIINMPEDEFIDLEEYYQCDYCNNRFIVKGKITFTVIKDDFDDEYVSSVYEDRLELE